MRWNEGFWCRRLPTSSSRGPDSRFAKGYLAVGGPVEVRIRFSDDGGWLTIKAGAGLVRTEVERLLTVQEASDLWAYTGGRQLEKTRYRKTIGAVLQLVGTYTTGLASGDGDTTSGEVAAMTGDRLYVSNATDASVDIVDASDSPTGHTLVVVANEITGTVSIYTT